MGQTVRLNKCRTCGQTSLQSVCGNCQIEGKASAPQNTPANPQTGGLSWRIQCIAAGLILAFLIGQHVYRLATENSAGTNSQPQAAIVQTRLVPFTTAQGQAAKMVLIDWRNTGTAPVKEIHASLTAYDASGSRLQSSVSDYTVFYVEKEARAVQPGATYREPEGEGWILFPFYGTATRVSVRLTRVN
jgi:hypothetical protein